MKHIVTKLAGECEKENETNEYETRRCEGQVCALPTALAILSYAQTESMSTLWTLFLDSRPNPLIPL